MECRPTLEYARELLSYIPRRPDYDTWVKVISAIGNTFTEAEALDLLLSHFQDEKPNEHYYKLQNRLNEVGFGSLVYLAEQNGYLKGVSYKKSSISRLYGVFRGQSISKYSFSKNPSYNSIIEKNSKLLWCFDDYELEERAGIMEFDGKVPRWDCERQIIEENPDCIRERVYRVAVNNFVLNKNLNPETRKPYSNYSVFTNNFYNKFFTLKEIIQNVGRGFPIMFCHLKGKERKKENFDGADLFAIDIDEGLTIEQALEIPETSNALFIYTTPSHTEDKHRFRIIFALPSFIDNPQEYSNIVSKFIEKYNADKQCKDPTRAFYGNDNAIVFLIQQRKKIQYYRGLL